MNTGIAVASANRTSIVLFSSGTQMHPQPGSTHCMQTRLAPHKRQLQALSHTVARHCLGELLNTQACSAASSKAG